MRLSFQVLWSSLAGVAALALNWDAQAQGNLDALAAEICSASPSWRDNTRTWLRESYPNREETTARAVQLLQSVGARKGCPPQQVSDFVGLAKVETCVIYPIDSICLRRFVVPKDAHAFDLQPAGGRL